MDTLLKEERSEGATMPAQDSFGFISPLRSFITSGCFRRIATPAQAGADPRSPFSQQLARAFGDARAAGIDHPLVVGAIPFDTRQPSELFIPASYQDMTPRQAAQRFAAASGWPLPAPVLRVEIPGHDVFTHMVARGASATRQPGIDKVVLSRLIDIRCTAAPDSRTIMGRLMAQNPTSFNFHVPLADGGVLLGASPELLVRKTGRVFSSLPLAGTARRDRDDPVRDAQIGDALMQSAKDRHEHALVIDAMRQQLQPLAQCLAVPAQPSLITTPTLWHLASAIEGESAASVLALACLLHPTPALSGFPHQQAMQLIAELEPFDRGLFGGIVGWCDEQGNGEWAVTIRSAHLRGEHIRLFAGAGIVPDSSPESEWRETGAKLGTMLNVLGLK
ncbi:isochorismate synthase [Shimwellia pseudoproteus]|uniref:isochorismate synthase n=1 Tax=Shimwellia pseudoproteus TaxID=570012 RepID=UPI0018ED7D9E|nr:isochorismate synthase [Shimwellia pseudoproteus]MBJ3815400.1 isochorismate synthase [Shimwellia pseudoproteus]